MTQPAARPTPTAARSGDELAALDLLGDAALVVKTDGTVEHANPLACRMLHRPLEELVGAAVDKVCRLRTDDGADWWESTCPLDRDPRLLPRIAEQDLTLHIGEATRAVALTGARQAGPDGSLTRLVLTLRRAEARRRRDTARSDLVSTVSHELRSPLTSVKGFTKTLLAKWDRFTDEQKKQMLETVNEDADRVTRLLGELLAVSRIDAGRLQLKRQMVDVQRLVNRVVERCLAGVGHGRDITCAVPELPLLYVDSDRLEQITSNLLENAVKYTDGPIVVAGREHDDKVELTVADKGDGVPPEHLAAIFTKFFRRPGERRQGTGLGLYINKGLVESHGGEVWAESTLGQGTTFHLTLPKGGLELAGIDMGSLRALTERDDQMREPME